MKRIASILLIVLLAAALLPAGALAADAKVVLSNQKLRVDGKLIECEKYNIDGYNYFKLRDLAALLNGTGSQFNVDYDTEARQMVVTTGMPYITPNGSELIVGEDKSATAAVSSQSFLVDGVLCEGLSVYNIGGGNFFQLKELEEVLGFKVDYDTASRTVIVISYAWSWPTPWLTQETIYNENGAATSHTVYVYDEMGRELSYLNEGEYGSESHAYTYDALGRPVKLVRDSVYSYGDDGWEEHSTTEYTYDIWGNLAKEIYHAVGDVVSETTYTYDDHGNLVIKETVNNAGSSADYYTYDENDREIKKVYAENDEVKSVEEFTLDADGNTIRSVTTDDDGEIVASYECVYENGRIKEETSSFGGSVYYNAFTYDEAGNVIHIEARDPYGSTATDQVFDENGLLVQSEETGVYGNSLQVWTYDERGLLVKMEKTSGEDYYYVEEYTYDEDGNILTDVYESGGFKHSKTYTYDRETRKMSCLVLMEYNGEG